MVKLKAPLLSFLARGRLGNITFTRRRKTDVAEKTPVPKDAKSSKQLAWRTMYQLCVDLWHTLSAVEKMAWESAARPLHMTGYAWYLSQCLRPNPGIYLPLLGGIMQGDIDMDANKIEDVPDPTLPQDADTKAARDAAIAAALAGSLHCDIYGYDGANWQTLLVQSAATKNLRVALYVGAGLITSGTTSTTLAGTELALNVNACLRGWDPIGNDLKTVYNQTPSDAFGNWRSLRTVASLMGYNGATWDRLRSYTTGILKVGRAEIDSTTLRKTVAGAVVGGARNLFWIACSPDAVNAEWELTDAVGGGQPVVYDHFDQDRASEMLVFDPPMKFATGIWIEKFDHIKSLTFCYI